MSARHRLTRRARAALRAWRATLPTEARAGLRLPSWRDQPLELIGAPVDAELAHDTALWTAQLVEYINSHEEVGFYLQERRFHICRAHAVARRVVRTGVIPADFACPRRATDCPFAAAAACFPGRVVKLRLAPPAGYPARPLRLHPPGPGGSRSLAARRRACDRAA